MAFDNSFTAVTGATLAASDWNTAVKGNFTAVWVGTTAGDIDYYTSSTAKSRLALGSAHSFLKSEGGSAPLYGALVYKRLGGSSTNYASTGSTTYTPTVSLIQCGAVAVTLSAGSASATITYPTAFSKRPIVFVHPDNGGGFSYKIGSNNGSTTSVTLTVSTGTGSGTDAIDLYWLAIGE